MPFLRRRGNISENDMRRFSLLDSLAVPKQPLSRSESTSDLPATTLASVTEDGPAPAVATVSAAPTSAQDKTMLPFDHGSSGDRPVSPFLPVQEENHRHRRFSMLRFRNASDSQLATKAKFHASSQKPPPLPSPPEIITTAPTIDFTAPRKKPGRMKLAAARIRRSGELPRVSLADETGDGISTTQNGNTIPLIPEEDGSPSKQRVTFDESRRPASSHEPPAYGDDHTSTLALPINRLSESSRSDASSGDRVYGSTTTTTHTVHTTTTFFRLGRRKNKRPEPLFPIAHLQPKSKTPFTQDSNVSRSSLSAPTPESLERSNSRSPRPSQVTPTPSRPSSRNEATTPSGPALSLFTRSGASPATALFRPGSRHSGHSSPTRTYLHKRGRSSTLSSLGRNSPRESVDEAQTPPTARASMSTGRKSFGDLLGLGRLRAPPSTTSIQQGIQTPVTPGSNTSKNNSLQLPRHSIILPERRQDDTPAQYLERLLSVVSRSVIAAAVSKGVDTFSQSVLRSYMRSFKFFEDPMDMAIRKLLMEAELPKETQQIDRTLQAFANRYHECNPGIYSSPDQAYFIAFSLLILHTDVFNKNNKHKMQKADYLKNTRGEGIFDEVLEVFYDNIAYTPFIHVEDDLDINGERIITHKAKKKSLFPTAPPDPAKRVSKEPIDPYTLIIDNKLDILRPNLKEVMHLDDPYSYLGTAKSLNMKELQKTFFKTGVLQIVSARSRPDAFLTEKTATNPEAAHPGIVDIKITKVGLIWRKDTKKKKTRSPWQEWGAILTGAQLYFFRNTAWIKSLMHQYDSHLKRGNDGDPCIFKPPLDQFKPDALMSTDGAVALMDSTYKKHKHAFVYVRHGGFEEVLLAEDDEEMNDWLAKLNYAAAFRSSGVRMRGVVGGSYDGQGRRALRRLDADNAQWVQTPTGDVMVSRSKIDHKMVQDILAARRDIMIQKVADANEKLKVAEMTLDSQLRNSRHLQILAPIQPKTREQMLLSAARMAAQLKWTRMEIWKLKCHRDILLMDLEEERQLLGLGVDTNMDVPEKSVSRETSKAGTVSTPQRSPQSPAPLSLTRTSTVTGKSDDDSSPMTDVFQTPPTSATGSSFHRSHNLWELPGFNFDHVDLRKASVSSAISSNPSVLATPPRNVAGTISPPPITVPEKSTRDGSDDEVDAQERELLAKTGLVAHEPSRQRKASNATAETDEGPERLDHPSNGTPADRHDKNKIRRSLQRTLREGAGHISHPRHRRGRDSVSSGAMSDDTVRDSPDILSRGSGSFVVHGKKASVITFGTEIQGMSPEERMRQWKQRDDAVPAIGSSSIAVESGITRAPAGDGADFRSILTARSDADRQHRGSAASASTATAKSFRELHRKYSSAQAAKGFMSNGSLALPSDEDSDAAISFSDGRRTPLPPIEGDSEHEDEVDGTKAEMDFSPPSSRDGRRTMFFTPEPASSPIREQSLEREEHDDSAKDSNSFSSPQLVCSA